MKKNVLLIVSTIILASCIDHEDLYDPSKVKADAKENFPLENIDPAQDWATRGTRTLDVTVNEKAEQTYAIKVFTANPLTENTDARLLAQTEVKDGVATSLKFDVALDLEYVYVMCKAGDKDYSVSAARLIGNKFVASFGKQATTRATAVTGGIEFDNDMYNPAGATNVEAGMDLGQIVTMGGKWQIASGQTFNGGDLQFMGAHLYVLGTLKVSSLRIAHGSAISILEGGTLIVDGTLTVSNGGAFYNAGTVKSDKTMLSSGGKWLNAGTYTGNAFTLLVAGTIAQNDCKLIIGSNQIALAQGTFINNGYTKCARFSLDMDAKLNLSGASVFSVDNEALLGAGTITGTTSKPYPLFVAGTLKEYNGASIIVTNTVYTTEGVNDFFASKFKVVKANIGAIPDGKCVPPISTDDDETEDLPVSGCTIGFEDISAKTVTDYDFNDVVLWVSNPVNDQASIYLVAVGATNSIKVGYALGDRTYYLFGGKEVHDLLGVSAGTMFNTTGAVATENLPMEILQVAGPVLEKLNFFIEVNGKTENLIYSKNDKEYIGGVPFGLCVNESWSFPTERTKINDAYKGFGEWGANKNTNPTWYKNGAMDLVCPFDSRLLKK